MAATLSPSELVALLVSLAGAPSDEADGFTELEHGLQCAFELSRSHPDDPELQLAGLFHDIGHQLGSDAEHGVLGGRAVRGALGDRIAGLVEAHVMAKRYLVATESSYKENLSEVSRLSLEVQGGPCHHEELLAFSKSPLFDNALSLRRADEAAKIPGRVVPSLEAWMPLVDQFVRAGSQT